MHDAYNYCCWLLLLFYPFGCFSAVRSVCISALTDWHFIKFMHGNRRSAFLICCAVEVLRQHCRRKYWSIAMLQIETTTKCTPTASHRYPTHKSVVKYLKLGSTNGWLDVHKNMLLKVAKCVEDFYIFVYYDSHKLKMSSIIRNSQMKGKRNFIEIIF